MDNGSQYKIDFSKREHRVVPNFLGIGVAKAGTTSVAKMLSKHPQINFPKDGKKEIHYFDEKYESKSKQWYFNLFRENIASGEWTPSYLYVAECRDRIYETLGRDVKFIVALRNPVDRAFSHFCHAINNWNNEKFSNKGYPKEFLSFEEAIENENCRLASGNWHIRHLSYFSKGLYAKQLKWYFQKFSPKNFFIYLLEEYILNPKKIYTEIFRFLNVDPVLDFYRNDIKLNAQTNKSLSPETKERLYIKYEPSIIELETLLNRDLSVWKIKNESNHAISKIDKNEHKFSKNRPIFIVGSPRSGTTLLQCMLSAGQETYSLPETHFFCTILPSLKIKAFDILDLNLFEQINKMLQHKMMLNWPDYIYDELRKKAENRNLIAIDVFNYILELFRPKNSRKKELRPVEKTPFHVLYLQEILSCFPYAQFINLVRDARDVASSRILMPTALHKTLEPYALDWNHCVRAAEKFASKFPDRITTIRYEDLVAKTNVSLQRICQFLEIKFDQNMISNFGSQYDLCTLSDHEPWKKEVSTGKIVKKIGVWKNRTEKCEARKIEKIAFNSMAAYGYPLEVSPIVLYQMGKVGSSAVYESLKLLNMDSPIYHIHYLTESGIEKIKKNNIKPWPRHLHESVSLRRLINYENENIRWKLISFVRDPIARNIFAFFQNIESWYPEIYSESIPLTSKIDKLINVFLKKYPHDIPIRWFDDELKQVFNIDVYEGEFPKEIGFKKYNSRKAELLLVRLENLDKCAYEAFTTYLDLKDFKLLKHNIDENKQYSIIYKMFNEKIELPKLMLEKMYGSKYARHFYTVDEINGFLSNWKTRIHLKSGQDFCYETKSNRANRGSLNLQSNNLERDNKKLSSYKPDLSKDAIIPANPPNALNISNKLFAKYKNIHQGQRCVIIGNGPSLNKMDLSFLKNEITFGLNRIYLLFEKYNFQPTYYVAVNKLVLEQFAKDIIKIESPKFLNLAGRKYFSGYNDIMYLKNINRPYFSKDPTICIWEGYTVTYVAMQLAYYMGFNEVILIGIDHYFELDGKPNKAVVSNGKDPNHFHPDYFGKGTRWQFPDLKNSEIAYRLAKWSFEQDGRRIIDATLGGKLNIFPKENYQELFKKYREFDNQLGGRNYSEIYYWTCLAQQKMDESNLDGALRNLESAIELAPNNASAHHTLGNLYQKKSIYHYKKAVELNPENIIIQRNLANINSKYPQSS